MHSGITFQALFTCAPPYFFIGSSGICMMGSIWAIILTISHSDHMAGQSNAILTMTLLPVSSAILSGRTITLMHPSNFLASSVAPVVSTGASSALGLSIECETLSSSDIVLTTSGAIINDSAAAFMIQKPTSGSNLVFLTGVGLSLLAAGFCAMFVSLPRVNVHLSALVNLTVRAPLSA